MGNHANLPEPGRQDQPKLSIMVVLSLALHLVLFSLIFFVPDTMPSRRISDTVYEVDLIEFSGENELGVPSESEKTKTEALTSPNTQERRPTQLIKKPKSKKRPIPIAKRTMKSKKETTPDLQEDSSKLLDEAMSKIEKPATEVEKTEDKEKSTVIEKEGPQSSRDLERHGGSQVKASGSGTATGISMEIYKRQVESRITENWSYPVALADLDTTRSLEAVMILNVKSDGTIRSFSFEKSSANTHFDQSVLKAVKKTESLPRFPVGYPKDEEELVITFSLKELLGN